MAQLCGQEPQAVIDVLKADDLIYLNPLKASEDNPIEGWEEMSVRSCEPLNFTQRTIPIISGTCRL